MHKKCVTELNNSLDDSMKDLDEKYPNFGAKLPSLSLDRESANSRESCLFFEDGRLPTEEEETEYEKKKEEARQKRMDAKIERYVSPEPCSLVRNLLILCSSLQHEECDVFLTVL